MEKKYVIILSSYVIIMTTLLVGIFFKISFAVDTSLTLPTNSFTSNLNNSNTNNLIGNALSSNTSYSDFVNNFKVPANYATNDNKLPLYSLMKNFEFSKTTETFELLDDNPTNVTNKGLLYIISHGYNKTNTTNTIFTSKKYGEVTDNNIKQYITQIAVWLYILENKSTLSDYCLETTKTGITSCDFYNTSTNALMTAASVRSTINQAATNNSYKYLGYIIDLVDAAKNYSEQESIMQEITTSTITYNYNDNNIVTSPISPIPSSNLKNYLDYNVTIEDPNNYGVYLIDSSNNKITNTNGLTSDFKIYIPLKSDITTMNLASIKITITGNFIKSQGYQYRVTKSSAGDLLNNKKQKYSNQMIAYVPITTTNISFNLKNFTKISKVDAANGNELPGATLVIKNASKNEVDKWVSTNTPHYIFLTPGDYELCETIAPDKYELNTECINFTVTNDKIISKTMKNSILEIPDTAANASTISYIIGIITLVSGVILLHYSLKRYNYNKEN